MNMQIFNKKNKIKIFSNLWKKNIDHSQTEERRNNHDTIALCDVHSRYCIHGIANVMKSFIQIQ
jgi:hypothetical protein